MSTKSEPAESAQPCGGKNAINSSMKINKRRCEICKQEEGPGVECVSPFTFALRSVGITSGDYAHHKCLQKQQKTFGLKESQSPAVSQPTQPEPPRPEINWQYPLETREQIGALYDMVDAWVESVAGYGVVHRGRVYELVQRAFRAGTVAVQQLTKSRLSSDDHNLKYHNPKSKHFLGYECVDGKCRNEANGTNDPAAQPVVAEGTTAEQFTKFLASRNMNRHDVLAEALEDAFNAGGAALRGEIARLTADLARCGKENCMGQTVDGCRSWVSKERLEKEQAEVLRLQNEMARLTNEQNSNQEGKK